MPAVCRGAGVDLDIPHCGPMLRLGLSPNVRVNSIGISRQTDINTPHLLPAIPICPIHVAPITTGSTTVKINSLGCGRIGDAITACTFVASGSENVFAGG